MACRGVLFAISGEELAKLSAALDDDAVLTIIQEEIEERWDEAWLYQIDKAWDAIHRCLTDGNIGFTNGSYPLSHCILGGRQLHRGENYIVALKTPQQAADIASALRKIDKAEFRKRYFEMDPADYGPNFDEQDFEYSWDWFDGLGTFYNKAATASRSVIFTVDQ
jgi:hypothetical protein